MIDRNHRTLVRDTNAGSVVPPERSKASGLGSTPHVGQRTRIGETKTQDRLAALDWMIGQVEPTVNERVKENQEARLRNGYNSEDLVQVANDLKKKNPFAQTIWGASPEMRGVQQRILENSNKEFYLKKMQNIEQDAGKYKSEDEYFQALKGDVEEYIEQFDDPEIKDLIRNQQAKQFGDLSWRFAVAHDAFKQGEQLQAWQTDLDLSNQAYLLDPANKKDDLVKAMALQEGQDADAHGMHLAEMISADLAKGNKGMYDVLMESGQEIPKKYMDNIESAKQIYDMKNDREALSAQRGLRDAIAAGDHNAVEEFAKKINDIKPGSVDLNQALMQADESLQRANAKAAKEMEGVNRLYQGQGGSTKDFNKLFFLEAQAARTMDNQASLQSGEITQEEFNELESMPVTQKEFSAWAIDNPDQVMSLLRLNPNVKTDVLNPIFSDAARILTTEADLGPWADRLDKTAELYKQLNRNPELVKKHVTSGQARYRMSMFNSLSKTSLETQEKRDIIRKAIDGGPYDNTDFVQTEDFQKDVKSTVRTMAEEVGIDKGWWRSDKFSNEDQLINELSRKANYYGRMFGEDFALELAKDELLHESGVINDYLIPKVGLVDQQFSEIHPEMTLKGYLENAQKNPMVQQFIRDNTVDTNLWGTNWATEGFKNFEMVSDYAGINVIHPGLVEFVIPGVDGKKDVSLNMWMPQTIEDYYFMTEDQYQEKVKQEELDMINETYNKSFSNALNPYDYQ